MDEEVSILKALWTARGPLTWDGKFYQLQGRADPPASAAAALSALLSRRRLAAGLGDLGQAFRRPPVLGRHLRAHPRQHGRDPRHGGQARPRERHRLRHAPADRLPRRPRRRPGSSPTSWSGHASEAQKAFVKERFATSEANPPGARARSPGRGHRAQPVDRHHPGAAGRGHRRGRHARAVRRRPCRTSSISAATPSASRATCTTRRPSASASG